MKHQVAVVRWHAVETSGPGGPPSYRDITRPSGIVEVLGGDVEPPDETFKTWIALANYLGDLGWEYVEIFRVYGSLQAVVVIDVVVKRSTPD